MNVLIVEDDAALGARIIGAIVERFPASDFRIAETVKMAREYLNSEEFDAITLDGRLLDGHGKTILNEMTADEHMITIVYSEDMEFLFYAHQLGITTAKKGESEDLIAGLYKIHLCA